MGAGMGAPASPRGAERWERRDAERWEPGDRDELAPTVRHGSSAMRVGYTAFGVHVGRSELHEPTPATRRWRVKRVIDMVTAGVMLICALPLAIVIALAIVLESGVPIFYYADRVSCGGRRMRMLKFRKMHRFADGPKLTRDGDPRLTRV